MEHLSELFSGTLGLVIAIAVVITIALWWLLLLFIPFFIYGMSRRSKEQLTAQHETNRLLRVLVHRDAPQHEESEDSRNPFR